MNKLEKEFASVFEQKSTKDWIEKIKTDLKGKPIEKLYQSYGDLKLDPFANFDEHSEKPQKLNDQKNTWLVSARIKLEKGVSANKLLLGLLTSGVNAPILEISHPISLLELNALFIDVEHQYLTTFFLLSDNVNIDPIRNYIANFPKANFILLNGPNAISSKLSVENITDYLADLLLKANGLPKNDFDSTKYLVEAHPHFMLNLAMHRALICLHANLLKANDIVPKTATIFTSWSSTDENENTNMIRNTAMAVSSILGGAIMVDIPFAGIEKDKSHFYQRMNINIQHLLSMESNLGETTDPLEGSYFFEDLTNQIVEKAWSKFINKI